MNRHLKARIILIFGSAEDFAEAEALFAEAGAE